MSKRNRRHQGPTFDRTVSTRDEKPTILIVCEGKNTEPSYFRQFRLATVKVRVEGLGSNTMDLVNRALSFRDEEEFDQVWVVFDKDEFDSEMFNAAIDKAHSKGIGVAYSNQSFEYWLILHFNDHPGGGMDRKLYHSVLKRHLKPQGLSYDGSGSKTISKELFDHMMAIDSQHSSPRVQLAIRRAERIEKSHKGKTPAQSESSTTVYREVEILLKHVG
jgi:hypothetical protein